MDFNRVNGNRPRVLFFSHETTLSGAPMQLLHLLPWLRDRGWVTGLAAPEAGPISDLLAAEGIDTVVDGTLLTDPSRTRLQEICAEFEVVVANTIVSWAAVRAAFQLKIPVIWYLHETLVAIPLMRQIPEIQPTLRMADLLITPTQRTAEIYQDLTDTPVAVVPYGIPVPRRVVLKKKAGVHTFVTLGSFEPRKGQDVLLEAIGLFNQLGPNEGSFKMAGRVLDTAFFKRLQARAAGLQNVELINALDHSEATALLNEADAIVSPSRDETMPIAILEAMALGKAVVEHRRRGRSRVALRRNERFDRAARKFERTCGRPDSLCDRSETVGATGSNGPTHFRSSLHARTFWNAVRSVDGIGR